MNKITFVEVITTAIEIQRLGSTMRGLKVYRHNFKKMPVKKTLWMVLDESLSPPQKYC